MYLISELDDNYHLGKKLEELNGKHSLTSYESSTEQFSNPIQIQLVYNDEIECEEFYLQCAEVLDMLEKEFLPFIQQENISISLVKKKFLDYRDLLNRLTEELRSIEPNTVYSGQEIISRYVYFKKRLQLDDHLNAVFSTGDGSCFYNSLAHIILGDEEFYFVIKICSIFMLLEN